MWIISITPGPGLIQSSLHDPSSRRASLGGMPVRGKQRQRGTATSASGHYYSYSKMELQNSPVTKEGWMEQKAVRGACIGSRYFTLYKTPDLYSFSSSSKYVCRTRCLRLLLQMQQALGSPVILTKSLRIMLQAIFLPPKQPNEILHLHQ